MMRRVQMTVGAGVIALALALGGACSRKETPPPPSGVPPLGAQPSAAAPAAPAPAKADPALPSGHPAVGQAPPPGFEGETPGGPFDPKETLRGTINIAPHLKSKVSPDETVYLSVRQDDGSERGGTILAVKKLGAGKWPIEFELDGRDAMLPGTKFEGKVVFWAHIDRDGDPITRGPGDLIGDLRTTIPAVIKLTIDRVIQ